MFYGKPRSGKQPRSAQNDYLGINLGIILGGCLLSYLLLGCRNNSPTIGPTQSSMLPTDSSPIAVTQSPPNSTANPLFTALSLKQPQQLPLTLTATIGDKTFQLAVAQTPEQQQIGLMFRTRLPDNEGMLFPFDPPRPVGFWMKNTLIALDMLYLRNGVIQEIKANVPPCEKDPCPTYPSRAEIDQVIEIRGGLAKELGIKSGDRVTLAPLKK